MYLRNVHQPLLKVHFGGSNLNLIWLCVEISNTSLRSFHSQDEETLSDEEQIHSLAVLIQEDKPDEWPDQEDEPDEWPDQTSILVITLTATMMERKTSGVTGFDLAADANVIIELHGQGKVPTGLSIELPWGPMAV